jgi:3-vinyl bacteriochlorophyllide hydratase
MNYTPEQLRRRNDSVWTPIQAVAAPAQFLTFIASVVLVVWYLSTGEGYEIAHLASLAKVAMMIFMTVTGMMWERDVFDRYFMAKEFFWEDFVNLISLIAHIAFIAAWLLGYSERTQMVVMCVALATYVVNFIQFGAKGIQAARQRRAMKMVGMTEIT